MRSAPAGQLPDFFQRHGLTTLDYKHCRQHIRSHFVSHSIKEAVAQGGCSWTVIVQLDGPPGSTSNSGSEDYIVQLRPAQYAIDPSTAADVRQWYGDLAPSFEELGFLIVGREAERFQVVKMSMLDGQRFDMTQPRNACLDLSTRQKLSTLLGDLAEFYARAWHCGTANGPSTECDGRVGSTILERLVKLETGLPSPALRQTAKRCRIAVQRGGLGFLPVVLTHGDMLPSNILVDSGSWKLTGLVDWAEAEYLPFGISLYGMDHLLGYLIDGESKKFSGFVWYDCVEDLRRNFWESLFARIPALSDVATRNAVKLARDVGVLLWHGIAFDDGRIDRVVEVGTDDQELQYLHAFLEPRGPEYGCTLDRAPVYLYNKGEKSH